MEKCFKLNAAKKFLDILSGSEFVVVGFLELGLQCDGFGFREVLSCFFEP